MFNPANIPTDVLPPILKNLTDRRDLHAAALVSGAFHRAAIPFLYVNLDSRLINDRKGDIILHPAETLLELPERAQHVRHVHEAGAVHGSAQRSAKGVTERALSALRLCTHLHSFSWVDDTFLPDTILLSFLDALQALPVQDLTIRTFGALSEEVWTRLKEFTRLRKVAIWCLEGPPRVLQGWSETLGSTLTQLELGRCAGVPATILISVLAKLPLLTDLRLKGAPSGAIPRIISFLPHLRVLDTDYIPSLVSAAPQRVPSYGGYGRGREDPHGPPPLPSLSSLTVRASSMDAGGPQRLWSWIIELVPRAGLESFTLNAFSLQGQNISSPFIRGLARVHGRTLKHFLVGTTQLTLGDLGCVADSFPKLETLSCTVASPSAEAIARSTADAHQLRLLRLRVDWIPDAEMDSGGDDVMEDAQLPPSSDPRDLAYQLLPGAMNSRQRITLRGYAAPTSTTTLRGTAVGSKLFRLEDAEAMMLRPNSSLRLISINAGVYTGRWVKVDENDKSPAAGLKFEVVYDISEDKRMDWT